MAARVLSVGGGCQTHLVQTFRRRRCLLGVIVLAQQTPDRIACLPQASDIHVQVVDAGAGVAVDNFQSGWAEGQPLMRMEGPPVGMLVLVPPSPSPS